jgi:hypothetical protein
MVGVLNFVLCQVRPVDVKFGSTFGEGAKSQRFEMLGRGSPTILTVSLMTTARSC